jgi:ABC-2 type transport system ATP-binding protein
MKLIIKNLSKTYSNGVRALNNINLEIGNGMFGLLGPNGAGKSTLMRIIATLQSADSGEVFFDDIDVLKEKETIRRLLGYLPQEFGVYPKISAETLLDHLAVLKGVTNKKERKVLIESLLIKTNLYNERKKKLGGFSGGMKQRFGIAQALLCNPTLIIVDEPTAGLDPSERNRFHNLLSEIGENTIVILSTHIVDDVKELCTDMAIIHKGEVLLNANPFEAIESIKGQIWSKTIEKNELTEHKERYNVVSEKMFAGKRIIHVHQNSRPDESFSPVEADLEDVYFAQIFSSDNGFAQSAVSEFVVES